MNREEAEIFYKEKVMDKIVSCNQDHYRKIFLDLRSIIADCLAKYDSNVSFKFDIKRFHLELNIPHSTENYKFEKGSYSVSRIGEVNEFYGTLLLTEPSFAMNPDFKNQIMKFIYSLGWDCKMRIDPWDIRVYIFYPQSLFWFKVKVFLNALFSR